MTPVHGAAVVPAAPLMLPEASPDQPAAARAAVEELRRASREVLTGLPTTDLVVLLSGGPRGIYDEARASLSPLGVNGADRQLPIASSVLEHFSRIAQYPMFRGDPLELTHTVLALQLHAARGPVPVLPVNVPRTTRFDVLVSVGASLVEALRDAGTTAAIVCPGDLSASLGDRSPRYVVPGSAEWDAEVVAAFEAGDLRPLAALGPEEAERVGALGWAPLAALHGICAAARLRPQPAIYLAPVGVGQLVARCEPIDGPAEDAAARGHLRSGP